MRVLLLASLFAPTAALACGGKENPVAAAAVEADQVAAKAGVDPSHCAKQAELVGGNCSYTTGMMAQRVLDEGSAFSFTGSLVAAANELDSRVAAPYTVGPDGAIHVVANEVIERLVSANAHGKRVALAGKLLDVDGVSYFVATDFSEANS